MAASVAVLSSNDDVVTIVSRPSSRLRGHTSQKSSTRSSANDDIDDMSIRPVSRQKSRENSVKVRNRGRSPVVRPVGALGTLSKTLEALRERGDNDDSFSSARRISKTTRRSNLEARIMGDRRANYTIGRSVESIRKHPIYWGIGMRIHFSKGPTIITSNIMIGSKEDAADCNLLRQWGVTHVLNVAKQVPNYHETSGFFAYMKIDLLDCPSEDVVSAMGKVTSFLERVEEINGRVFVHCIAGVSRSVTVILMYFILKHKFPLRKIYNYIVSCRPQIAVNEGFKLQSAQLEVKVHGCTSTSVPKAGPDWDFYSWNSVKHDHPKMLEERETCCNVS